MYELFQSLDLAWQIGIVLGGGVGGCAIAAKVLSDAIF